MRRVEDEPSRIGNEFNELLIKFRAEDVNTALEYRESAQEEPQTKWQKLKEIWERHFEGFNLYYNRSENSFRVENPDGDDYLTSRMSDGEREALYQIAKIIDSNSDIIIVDEPTLHLHDLLAKKLWNDLEREYSESRFVYISHNLNFAFSRKAAQVIVKKAGSEPEIIGDYTELSDSTIKNIVGAATFSLSASRVVLCEGRNEGIDDRFYNAWINDDEVIVNPVKGGCRDVENNVRTFNNSDAIRGVDVIGIIDRDYRDEQYLGRLPDNVFSLELKEIESLFCVYEVFRCVALYEGEENIEELHDEAIEDVRAAISDYEFKKVLFHRTRSRIKSCFDSRLNNVEINQEVEELKEESDRICQSDDWEMSPSKMMEEERSRLISALRGSFEDILKFFPGRLILNKCASVLNININRYEDLVISFLRGEEPISETELERMRERIANYLPAEIT